jgi:hypothetical protein
MCIFRTGDVDIGSLQDEFWDKTRSLFGMLEGDISIYWKVTYGRFQDDNKVFQKMKNDLTTGTWQENI